MKPLQPAPSPRYNALSQRRLSLRLKSKFDARSRRIIKEVISGLPELFGGPLCISARPHLKSHRGKLLSGLHMRGTSVYAASFIRKEEIVLERQLLAQPEKLRLILIHEVFHFVWPRLGNTRRSEYAALIETELAARARGEVGESANRWKGIDLKTYICESFCDTAAWLYGGLTIRPEFTLAARWCKRRSDWFQSTFGSV